MTDEEILESIENSNNFDEGEMVWYIIYKLAEEFTNKNVDGQTVDYNNDLTIAIRRTGEIQSKIGTSSITGTITIKSKAVPSMKTVGKIESNGTIIWKDTFNRTSSSGDKSSELLEIIMEISSSSSSYEDYISRLEEAGVEQIILTKGVLFTYEGGYYAPEGSEESPSLHKLDVDLSKFGVQEIEGTNYLITPSTPDHLIHENYEGPNTYGMINEETGEPIQYTGYCAHDYDGLGYEQTPVRRCRYYDSSGTLVREYEEPNIMQ